MRERTKELSGMASAKVSIVHMIRMEPTTLAKETAVDPFKFFNLTELKTLQQ